MWKTSLKRIFTFANHFADHQVEYIATLNYYYFSRIKFCTQQIHKFYIHSKFPCIHVCRSVCHVCVCVSVCVCVCVCVCSVMCTYMLAHNTT